MAVVKLNDSLIARRAKPDEAILFKQQDCFASLAMTKNKLSCKVHIS